MKVGQTMEIPHCYSDHFGVSFILTCFTLDTKCVMVCCKDTFPLYVLFHFIEHEIIKVM